MATGDKTIAQRFEQISQELHTLTNVLSRIDERVEIFIGQQEQLSEKLDEHITNCPVKCEFPEFVARLTVLEQTAISKNGIWSKIDHQDYSKKLDNDIASLKSDVNTIQRDMQKIELTSQKHEGIWKNVGGFAFQFIVYVLGVVGATAILHFLQLVKN